MKLYFARAWAAWSRLLQPNSDFHLIRRMLLGAYAIAQTPVAAGVLDDMADDLVAYGHAPEDVLRACRALRMGHVPEHKVRRAPTSGDIHNYLVPHKAVIDRADVAMQSLMGAIATYGYMQGDLAREALGETVWATVTRLGGWQSLCRSTSAQDTTQKAQFKKSLEAEYNAELHDARRIALSSGQRHKYLAEPTPTQAPDTFVCTQNPSAKNASLTRLDALLNPLRVAPA